MALPAGFDVDGAGWRWDMRDYEWHVCRSSGATMSCMHVHVGVCFLCFVYVFFLSFWDGKMARYILTYVRTYMSRHFFFSFHFMHLVHVHVNLGAYIPRPTISLWCREGLHLCTARIKLALDQTSFRCIELAVINMINLWVDTSV